MLNGRPVSRPEEWRWRTFPVFFAFSATFFLTAVLCALLGGKVSLALLTLVAIVAAVPLAFALAHLVTVRFIAPHAPTPQRRDEP